MSVATLTFATPSAVPQEIILSSGEWQQIITQLCSLESHGALFIHYTYVSTPNTEMLAHRMFEQFQKQLIEPPTLHNAQKHMSI